MTNTPIALTVGEPAGIGPEIAGKAWRTLREELVFFWIGDPAHLPADLPVEKITAPAQAANAMATGLPVLAHDFPGPVHAGHPNPAHAQPVIDVIARAVGLAQSGAASAVCTAPIHKKALKDGAKFGFAGHTEYLAHLAGVACAVMMLACNALRVVPVTIHIPLSEVPRTLTPALLRETIRVTHAGLLRDFGIANPRIAVTGLNPHAGEGGIMGHEDAALITPVIQSLAAEGFAISGPHPADTLFHETARAQYDVAIAMYHDQALIPIKTLDFERGVNITLGLPFIRTSPDHGTAMDIAGQNTANPASLIEALRMAQAMATNRGTC